MGEFKMQYSLEKIENYSYNSKYVLDLNKPKRDDNP